MNIIEIYRLFPTDQHCLKHLEKVRWQDKPVCPYCKSPKSSPLPKENRYHCNSCNTSYSVTVHTIFHRTRLPLQKWFLAISLILNAKKGLSARQLSRDLQVNKDTAWFMAMRIRKAMFDSKDLLSGIVEMDELYVGGKPRKGSGTYNKRGRGTKKIPIVGMAQRDGSVKAKAVRNLKGITFRSLIRENIDTPNTTIITDEFTGYSRLSTYINHQIVNHKIWYVDGDRHTNSIESFWALLKRGIVGQFHKVSIRYLPRYIDEFCFRFNNRRNQGIFDTTILRALGGIENGRSIS